MRLSASVRQSRSKKRQALWLKLEFWVQREKDPDAVSDPSKADFARQEQAKLRKQIHDTEVGVKRQRAWVRGENLIMYP